MLCFMFCFVTYKKTEAKGHKLLAYGDRACKWQSRDSNPGSFSAEVRVGMYRGARCGMHRTRPPPNTLHSPTLSPGVWQLLALPLTERVTLSWSPPLWVPQFPLR